MVIMLVAVGTIMMGVITLIFCDNNNHYAV
nr:MAG TPA: hypothetical protein [Caudoviricetes sp.]